MPLSKIAFVRTTILFMLAGLVALLLIVGVSLWLVARTQGYVEQVVQARETRSAIADLMRQLQDAETGQRGFLLTQEQSYLRPFIEVQAQIPPTLARLQRLIMPDPQANAAMPRLTELVQAKLAELSRTVEMAERGDIAAAVAMVRQDRGKALMDEARTLVGAMLERADGLLADRIAEQRSSATALRWVTIAGGIIIALVFGGCAYTVFTYTRQLAEARIELEGLNASLEERVKERTADLGRANDEIQRFAYIVSHDLRSPLVNIMGFTSELEASLATLKTHFGGDRAAAPGGEELRRTVEEDLPESIGFIRSSTRKMDALINAILKLSREGRRTLKPERLSLEPLLQATAASVQHQIGEAEGEIVVDAKVPPIVSDRLALEQIFGNLVDNAVKYRHPARAPRITIAAKDEGLFGLSIRFADNGRGIAAQDHERVFELFRRSGAQDQQGEGIGLAHVRALVRNLGGEITLESELGQGSTFCIRLPRDLAAVLGSKAS